MLMLVLFYLFTSSGGEGGRGGGGDVCWLLLYIIEMMDTRYLMDKAVPKTAIKGGEGEGSPTWNYYYYYYDDDDDDEDRMIVASLSL